MRALYDEDKRKVLRKSHENPFIKAIYKEFLGEPYGPVAKKLLHTKYVTRPFM